MQREIKSPSSGRYNHHSKKRYEKEKLYDHGCSGKEK